MWRSGRERLGDRANCNKALRRGLVKAGGALNNGCCVGRQSICCSVYWGAVSPQISPRAFPSNSIREHETNPASTQQDYSQQGDQFLFIVHRREDL